MNPNQNNHLHGQGVGGAHAAKLKMQSLRALAKALEAFVGGPCRDDLSPRIRMQCLDLLLAVSDEMRLQQTILECCPDVWGQHSKGVL